MIDVTLFNQISMHAEKNFIPSIQFLKRPHLCFTIFFKYDFCKNHQGLSLLQKPFGAQPSAKSLVLSCSKLQVLSTYSTFKASSPACTELETIVMDWLGKMIGLPHEFLHSNEQTMGGGVIQVKIEFHCYSLHLLNYAKPKVIPAVNNRQITR